VLSSRAQARQEVCSQACRRFPTQTNLKPASCEAGFFVELRKEPTMIVSLVYLV
jgi:hypothetical protein